ncbi:Mannose-1-phosphate guanyltransferase beta, partial [Paragonimus heterotremus]
NCKKKSFRFITIITLLSKQAVILGHFHYTHGLDGGVYDFVGEVRAALLRSVFCFSGKIMKALILIGGYGTRLRPLTLSIPKPIVEFCNRPMLLHQVEALLQVCLHITGNFAHEVDIDEIILAINRQAASLEQFIRESCKLVLGDRDVKLTFSYEEEALDTGINLDAGFSDCNVPAGPLAQAAPILTKTGEPFFVLNSDIICNYPFKEMLDFHLIHGHEGTMAVTKVEEPSKYGAVVHNDRTGLVKYFVEKPSEYVANRINAGLYIFNPNILDRIQPNKPTSIETSVFPSMVNDGELYCLEFSGEFMAAKFLAGFFSQIRI